MSAINLPILFCSPGDWEINGFLPSINARDRSGCPPWQDMPSNCRDRNCISTGLLPTRYHHPVSDYFHDLMSFFYPAAHVQALMSSRVHRIASPNQAPRSRACSILLRGHSHQVSDLCLILLRARLGRLAMAVRRPVGKSIRRRALEPFDDVFVRRLELTRFIKIRIAGVE